MISTMLSGLCIALAVSLVVLLLILVWDEGSLLIRLYPCQLRDGRVVEVKVISRSVFALIVKWITRDVFAVTLWNRVYVAGYYLVPRGVQHEMEHVRQWHDHGPFGFVGLHLWHLLTMGWHDHPLEQEARIAAGQPHSGRRR